MRADFLVDYFTVYCYCFNLIKVIKSTKYTINYSSYLGISPEKKIQNKKNNKSRFQ